MSAAADRRMEDSSAGTAMKRLDILGSISDEPNRLTREFAGEAMRRANDQVEAWMREAGMVVRHDNIGNLRARYEADAAGAPVLILGSHLDSVRDAGKYDGPLGVVVAIAAVQRLHDAGRHLPFTIEVIAFADEEGLRFSSTYLGSRAVAGSFDLAILNHVDADGISLAEAVKAFGGDLSHVADDRWNAGRPLGYVEVHIEQGPVLERIGLPVGVVTAIAGQARYLIRFTVEADAGAHEGVVATVGQLTVHPGASNVIPGLVELSLDVRHADERVRAEHTRRILERAEVIGARRGV